MGNVFLKNDNTSAQGDMVKCSLGRLLRQKPYIYLRQSHQQQVSQVNKLSFAFSSFFMYRLSTFCKTHHTAVAKQ